MIEPTMFGPAPFAVDAEPYRDAERVIVWFSCGAASAAAARLVIDAGITPTVVYCDTMSTEHPDNQRFYNEVQEWLGVDIVRLSSDKYDDIDDVFESTRWMAGIAGARCTTELKKLPRREFENVETDVQVFGFTADEADRSDRFRVNNPEVRLWDVLGEAGCLKVGALEMVQNAGIELPAMYRLGYNNNNCLGCVKATSANYWNRVRRDFPDVFDRRVRQSRELDVRLVRVEGERVFLDELPEDYLPVEPVEDISCGPDCSTEVAA